MSSGASYQDRQLSVFYEMATRSVDLSSNKALLLSCQGVRRAFTVRFLSKRTGVPVKTLSRLYRSFSGIGLGYSDE